MNTNTTHNTAVEDDGITLKELILKFQEWWRYLLSKWLVILIAGFIGGGLGFGYSLIKKTTYTATLTFVLEDEKSSGLGSLGGLAAMAGINVGGGGGGGLFQGDNIFALYKSRSMLSKTLLSQSLTNDSLLIERYITFNELRKSWADKPALASLSFSIPSEQFTLQHDSLIGVIVNSINKANLTVSKPDNKGSLIQVTTVSIDEKFSKDFTEVLVQNVNKFYVETKTKKSSESLNILQFQTDSVRRELNAAIGGVAIAMDANPNANPARQALYVPSTKRQVDVQANQAILTELVKNLELTKLSLLKETPLIQIIDQPVLPLKKQKMGIVKGVVFGGLIFGFLTLVILLARRIIREILAD